AAGSEEAIRFMGGERIVNPGVAPDVEGQNRVECVLRKWEVMDARAKQASAGLAAGGEFQGVLALIDTGQLGERKFLAQLQEHSTGAATGIEERKFVMGRLQGSRDMLTEGLVPPIAILDRTHHVMLLWRHRSCGLTRGR